MDVLFISLGVFIALAGGFLLQGLRYIPADPPHVAIVTVRGVPQEHLPAKKSGWRFFPLCPWWHGYILVDVSEKDRKVSVKVRTPDRQESEVPFSMTVAPCVSDCDSRLLLEYIESGRENGALNQLEEMTTERIREWAFEPTREPKTWDALIQARRDAAKEILSAVADGPAALRADEVDHMRQGRGRLVKSGLGVMLKRLSLGEIKPLGKVAEKAGRLAEERQEREAEQLELEHLRTEIEKLTGMGVSRDAAIEIIQVERGKSTKAIEEKKYNLSAETRAMIEKIAPSMLDKILGRGSPNAG